MRETFFAEKKGLQLTLTVQSTDIKTHSRMSDLGSERIRVRFELELNKALEAGLQDIYHQEGGDR